MLLRKRRHRENRKQRRGSRYLPDHIRYFPNHMFLPDGFVIGPRLSGEPDHRGT
jgi:hypothetical protein